MAVLAVYVHLKYNLPLVDPEGSFIGPSYVRLPVLLLAAIGVDLVPRALWMSRGRPTAMPGIVRERLRTHWSRERLTLVALGVICFYLVYVSYRNLKSAVPVVRPGVEFDSTLRFVDRVLFFGHNPGPVLHQALGANVAAWGLSFVYLWFLPLVPIALTIWLVWSRNLSFGYWFATSQCLAWSLGTASYYALPTLGPAFSSPAYFSALPDTPTEQLVRGLSNGHLGFELGDYSGQAINGIVNSIAGFASLHCAITLLMALMVQYTLRIRWLKILFWVNFGFTILATIYFGWHFLADDVAGILIALVSFYVGGLATGQQFDRRRRLSPATNVDSAVPAEPLAPRGRVVSPG